MTNNLATVILRHLFSSNASPTHMHQLVDQVHARLNPRKPEPEVYAKDQVKAEIAFLVRQRILSDYKGLVGLTGPQRTNVEQWMLVADILSLADKPDNPEGVTSAGSKGDLQSTG
jgi:hypothetical protein